MKETQKTTTQARTRYRLLYKLESNLETPMFLLAILWLFYVIKEFISGLSPFQEKIVVWIWVLFILEFVLKLWLSKDKLFYIKSNWLTAVGLVIPAFRVFRLLRALRILRASRVVTTTKFIRALSSTKRFMADLREVQGQAPTAEMNVGVLVALSPLADEAEISAFGQQLVQDIHQEITAATGIKWIFHFTDPNRLDNEHPHNPTDFLDSASHRMAEGPFDLVVVITDVPLVSHAKRTEVGLASVVTRVLVLSTKKFVAGTKDQSPRPINSPFVRWNAAHLFLHLMGHVLGLKHVGPPHSKVMIPFSFSEIRSGIPSFNEKEKSALRKRSARLPERELWGGNALEGFIFHVLMAMRHPWEIVKTIFQNSSILLSLSLPGLATAAVAPSFLLVFSAEMWDVGLTMTNGRMLAYAFLSIMGASFYLVSVQSLFLPRKEKRVLTEHLAVGNSIIFLSILNACIGLFLLVGALILFMETYIFPEGLMKTWPSLMKQNEITWVDKIRLAAFIGTVGVTTGALAGGMESRKVVQHLSLFKKEP